MVLERILPHKKPRFSVAGVYNRTSRLSSERTTSFNLARTELQQKHFAEGGKELLHAGGLAILSVASEADRQLVALGLRVRHPKVMFGKMDEVTQNAKLYEMENETAMKYRLFGAGTVGLFVLGVAAATAAWQIANAPIVKSI